MPVSRSLIALNARLTSAVKIEDESPKLEALLMRIASSRLEVRIIASTGPKISSTAMRASGFTPANTVGRKKCPRASAPSDAASPGVGGGPPRGGRIEPVAELERRGPFRHAPHQLVVHLLVHDHAAARGAALPRRAGRAPPDRGGGGAQ